MRARVFAVSDVGCVRKNNEDMILAGDEFVRDGKLEAKFGLDDDDRLCLAVADGMGGLERGEEASRFVLERLAASARAIPSDLDPEELAEVFRVFAEETHRALPRDSGSTLAGLFFYRGELYRFHSGDSRLWRFRDGELTRLTRDHSLRESGGKPGAPSNVILNAFGAGVANFLEFASLGRDWAAGDVFLLTSDGLHDLVGEREIGNALRGIKPTEAIQYLLSLAKDRGGKDNISILIASVE